MDRFIDQWKNGRQLYDINLKSNMDRFIALTVFLTNNQNRHLKSNMDRFIDTHTPVARRHFLI